MTDLVKNNKSIAEAQLKNVSDAINALRKSIYENMHPQSFQDECVKLNSTLKSQLQNAKNDLEKLRSEYGNRKLSDALKIDNLEAGIKSLRAENSELQNVKNELKKLQSDHSQLTEKYNQLKDERLGYALKIDVLEAGMKTLEAEKRTFEVKFDEVSSKLKLKTHEYDSLLKSKQTDCQVKLVFKSNETEKASIATQTIKEEPKEIGVVNVPASFSSQPKNRPVKTVTKRTSRTVEDRKIAKAKRMKTEKSNSISRATKQSIENQHKISCSHCFAKWGKEIENKYDANPDQTGAPNPNDSIRTFSSLHDYKIHVQQDGCNDTYCPALNLARDSFPVKCYRNTESICKICDSRFWIRADYEQHIDTEHCNLNDRTNKQIFDLYLKYKSKYCG